MKKIIASIASALFMTCTLGAFANDNSKPLMRAAAEKMISNYLEAATQGDAELHRFVLTDDFEYSNEANGDRYGKKAYSRYLKQLKGLQYDCDTDYELLEQGGESCLAKVTMAFGHFTRIDHIRLLHTPEGWKVRSVHSSYAQH